MLLSSPKALELEMMRMCQPLMPGIVRSILLILLILSAWHARSVSAQSQAVHIQRRLTPSVGQP